MILEGLKNKPSRTGLQQALSKSNFRVSDSVTGNGTIQFGDGAPVSKGDRVPDESLKIFVEVVQKSPGEYNFQRTQ